MTEKRSEEMSLLDTIKPALQIDPGTLVAPEGVTNLEKFLPAYTGQHFPKSRCKLAARARAARDQIQRPVHSPKWRGC